MKYDHKKSKIAYSICLGIFLIASYSCDPAFSSNPTETPGVTSTPAVTASPTPTPVVTPAPTASTNSIKVGSFNTGILGNTKIARTNTMNVMAKIATNFDVLALQEVGSNASTSSDATCISILNAYVSKINTEYGSSVYSYIQGNQYAIIYRTDKIEILSSGLYTGSQTFSYTPLIANCRTKTGNFDFSLITIHTSPSKAVTEVPSLVTAMDEIVTQYGEADVICLGDYNADGTYYTEGVGADLNGFSTSTYITGIPNSADTTVASSSNTYDRIEMTKSLSSDFSGTWGVLQFGSVYDLTTCEGTASTAGTEEAVSDHYPVWCTFSTNADTD